MSYPSVTGALWPGRHRSVGPLEGQSRAAMGRQQDQPIVALRVGGCMSRSVRPSEQVSVKFSEGAWFRAVDREFIKGERCHAQQI